MEASTEQNHLIWIIERYNGHFSLSKDGMRLFDRFCGRTVSMECMKDIDGHVQSQEHQNSMRKFAIKQKIEKIQNTDTKFCKKDKDSVDKLTDQLNTTVEDMEIDNIEKLDDSFISNFLEEATLAQSKLSKVEIVHKALKHGTITDAEGSFVNCSVCDEKLSDQFSLLAMHLISSEHQKAMAIKASECGKKITSGVIEYVCQNEFLVIKTGTVKCLPCGTEFKDSKLSTIKDHMASQKHSKGVQLYGKRTEREIMVNEKSFNCWLVLLMASNDIPFHKVTGMRDFLEGFIGRRILTESNLREHLGNARSLIQEEVRRQIGDKNIFISMDEATNTRQTTRFVTTIVGTLNPENPSEQKVFVWKFSEVKGSWDTSAVINLFMTVVHEIYGRNWLALARKHVKLFLTDGGSQMVCAAKKLTEKNSFPDMTFFICLCHNLNNLCESICGKYKVAVAFVSAMNYILYCSPKRMDTFRNLEGFQRVPTKIVNTRWGSGLRAIAYWHQNFELARKFLATLDKGNDAQVVAKARKLLEDPELRTSLETVFLRYTFIADIITKLETRNMPLSESFRLVEEVENRLNQCAIDNIGKELVARLKEITTNNQGFSHLRKEIGQIDSNEKLRYLKFAPGGSFETERGNKIFKRTLTDDRSRMTFENADNWSYIKFNCIQLNFKDTVKSKHEKEQVQFLSQKGSFGQLFGFAPEYDIVMDHAVDISTSLNDSCHTSVESDDFWEDMQELDDFVGFDFE